MHMKQNLLTVMLVVLLGGMLSSQLMGQSFSYTWKRVPMDTTWESTRPNLADSIMMKYHPGIEPLMEIIAYSDLEMDKGKPESSLSNLAADIILETALPYTEPDDRVFSLTNFGGIRTSLPKGAVRIYDIYSIFPFENSIVVVEVSGADVRKQLQRFASRNNFEALGGVEIEVRDGKMTKCNVGGAPLEDDRIYKLATIDFLLGGGDKVFIGSKAIPNSLIETKIVMRDAVVSYLKKETQAGRTLSNRKDGRVVVHK